VRHIDVLVLVPTRDLGALALQYADHLPRTVHHVLRGFGSTRGTGANLISYLLFDRAYCRALMQQGFEDAMARRDELAAFLADASVNFLPLFPPEWR
jgi:NTE family protein